MLSGLVDGALLTTLIALTISLRAQATCTAVLMSSVPNIARGPHFLHSIPCHAPGRDDSIHAFAGARHYDVFLAIRVALIRFDLRCLRSWGSFF